jgi:hypothetical protein
MTSFAVAIEPGAQPRLAATVFLVHAAAAAWPWLAGAVPALAASLSMVALSGLVLTLGRVPGRHCRLLAVDLERRECRVRLSGRPLWLPAKLGPGARAQASLVLIEVLVGGRRFGWLLPRGALPAADFRRLKARIRLSC